MNFKFAYESLVRKLFFTISTIIQLLVSVIVLYIVITESSYINENSKKLMNLFEDNYYVIEQNQNIDLENIELDKIIELKKLIEKAEGVDLYAVNETSIYIGGNKYLDEGIIPNDTRNIDDSLFARSKTYYVNDKYIEDVGIELEKGEYKSEYDGYTPVLLGYNYLGKYEINDKIPYIVNDDYGNIFIKEMIVTGFIKKGSILCENGYPSNLNVIDNYIIMPFNISEEYIKNINFSMVNKINIFNYIVYGYYKVENIDTLSKVEQYSTEIGLNLSYLSLDKKVGDFEESMNRSIAPVKLFLISFLMFTSISIIIVILNMININMSEYYVHMLLGATFIDILKRICYEIFIIFFLSTILGAISINILFKVDEILMFDILNFGKIIGIMIVIFILILVLPIIKLRKKCINNNLRSYE